MKNLILSTLLVFVVNGVLTYFIDTYFSFIEKNGVIIITEPIKIDSLHFTQTFQVINLQKKSIENLEFGTYSGEITNVFSNNYSHLNLSSKNNFTVTKIYPLENLTLKFDLILKGADVPYVYPLNSLDFSFSTYGLEQFRKETNFNLFNTVIFGLIVSTFYFLFRMYFNNKLESSNKELKSTLEKLTDLQKESNGTKKSILRIKLLLIKHAKDLKIENEFFKRLITKLISNNEVYLPEEAVFKLVREELKTYSTKKGFDSEIDSIDIISHMIKDKNES